MSNWVVSPDKYLTSDEVKQLRRTCLDAATLAKSKGNQAPVRDAMIIELALGTGLRVSELSKLKVADLYLKKGQNSLQVINGKGGKDRLVHFSPGLKSSLLEFIDYQSSDSEFLFPSQRGMQMTSSGIQQVFKKWAKKAGLSAHYSIHALRHTYAVRLYKAGGYNLRLLQQQLGHSSVSTTQVYAHVLDKDVDIAMVNLDLEEE